MNSERAVAERLAYAAIMEHRAKGDPFLIRHRVQITSLGGSGTTALTKAFIDGGLELPPGPGQWPHKHLRRPPTVAEVPDGFRVVYPVGDPRDAVLSIFRRGIQGGHWSGLTVVEDHDEPPRPPASLETFETFMAAGVDEFDLEGHLDAWWDHPPGYPVMFLRFDLIEEAWDDLVEFVGLPSSVAPIRYESRQSDWRSADPDVRTFLDRLYGGLAARIEALPAVTIR